MKTDNNARIQLKRAIITCFFGVLFFFGTSLTTIAQFTTQCGTVFYVEKGQTFYHDFDRDGPGSGTWSMSGCSYLNIDPTTGVVSGIIPSDAVDCDFEITFGIYTCATTTFKLRVFRPGSLVMLVLDKSGSMGQAAAGGSGDTKWQVLTGSVSNFLEAYRAWEASVTPDPSDIVIGSPYSTDSIGVVFFSHERGDYVSASSLHTYNPIPTPDTESEINTFISGLIPGGATCLGGGVLAAYQAFDWDSHRKKHIIVFSDGMQNRNPQYNELEDKIYTYGTASNGFLEIEELDFTAVDLEEFKVHTVCIGDVALNALMLDLTTAHSNADFHGEYHGITSMEDLYIDMDDNFTALFVSTLEGFSPAIVDKKINTIQGDVITNKFQVNNSADRILIKAVGKNIGRAKIEIEKDGIFFSNWIKSEGSFVHFFAKKDTVEALGATMGGEWIIRFNGEKGTRFSTTCIIDDEYIDYECSVENQKTEPGDVLQLKLNIKAKGSPLTDLSIAKAFVLKPGQDINDLFANTASPDSLPKGWSSEPGNFAGQNKYEQLIALDPEFVEALKLVSNGVELSNNGDGSYSGQFVDTEESGVYRVIFKIEGEHADNGKFQRYHMISKVIDFGLADESSTTFEISSQIISRNFVIKPVNKFGHLIGPNRLASINLTMGGKKLELVDNLDGTYTAKVPFFTLFKRNAIVELNIKSQKYAETKYKDIKGASLGQDLLIDLGSIILILIIIILIIRKILKK